MEKAAEERAKQRKERAKEKLAFKEVEKERKRLAKEETLREKDKAAAVAKVNTLLTNKKKSTMEMIVQLPSSLGLKLADQIQIFLKDREVEHRDWQSPLPIIKWMRKVNREYDEENGHWRPVTPSIKSDKHVMYIMSANEFVDLAIGEEGNDLDAHVLRLKLRFASSEIIYLIEGLDNWIRRNKTVKNRKFEREMRNQMPEEPSAGQKRKKKSEA